MERLVVFGKGGIGKSTTSCNLSAAMTMAGKRVLHVGCDPKQDSTVSLLRGEMLTAMTDREFERDAVRPEDIVVRSPLGVDCVEAGGPSAGQGCGGRAITRMMEVFRWAELVDESRYDTILFDVLGDLVCGGFAAPLSRGIGRKVVIVASEEVMALYAANNIAHAVVNYAGSGARLAGILVNLRSNETDRAPIERFARLINTRILGYVPRDELIREAEYQRTTVVEMAPEAPISMVYRELAERIAALDEDTLPTPVPLDARSFYEHTRSKFAAGAAPTPPAEAPAPTPTPASALAPAPAPGPVETGAAPDKRFDRDLAAGIRAVRLGLVEAGEALRRLRLHYPLEASDLSAVDLRV